MVTIEGHLSINTFSGPQNYNSVKLPPSKIEGHRALGVRSGALQKKLEKAESILVGWRGILGFKSFGFPIREGHFGASGFGFWDWRF